MKLCKKLMAVLFAAALLFTLLAVPAAAEVRTPEVPEGYDGFVVMSVEALPLGFDYLIMPTYVPFHEGESVAEVTVRLFEEAGLSYSAGDIESFYLTSVEWPYLDMLTPRVPDYLMEQLIENYCYDEEEGWDQPEPTGNMLAAGNYTYYSGWMIAENDEITPVGAAEVTAVEGNVYRWMYSIYGYGMDIGMSDGWGMFPEFENPAMGVQRSDAYTILAEILSDPDLENTILNDDELYSIYSEFYNTIVYQGSTQEEIDAVTIALIEALIGGEWVLMGDVDLDGEITISDSLLIMRHAMGLIALDGDALEAADYDESGEIDVTDALLVMRVSMGLAD